MPNVEDLSKSNYLKKNDVLKPLLVTIESYGEEEFDVNYKKEVKNVLYFKELSKGLVLNITQGLQIRAITNSSPTREGTEFEQWIGKKIVLYHDPAVVNRGKVVGGIRVRAPKSLSSANLPDAKEQASEETFEQKYDIETDDEL